MKHQPLPSLVALITAYHLHASAAPLIEQIGQLLSSQEPLTTSKRRRLTLARASLRASQTHLAKLWRSDPVEHDQC